VRERIDFFIAVVVQMSHHILPLARRFLPYVGMVTILRSDYPQLKVALLVVLGVLALFQKEEK
jgi:hypothetical protein